jgi:TetR/AcrR family transcriptional regulator
MARPRAATYDGQRAQILAAAATLFARRGYTATTMNEVAAACGVSKATLYHYVSDKAGLLEHIARGHVERLEAPSPTRLRELIARFMRAYADAQDEHRVLTEDVKFLPASARNVVLAGERRVVAAFADAIAEARPGLDAPLRKPLAMLLFGMINWTFTWLRPAGRLSHDALAPVVADLFLGGLGAVQCPAPNAARRTKTRAR